MHDRQLNLWLTVIQSPGFCRFENVQKLSHTPLVYLVEVDGKPAVAKLCNNYGWAVHESWAEGGLAPRLLLEHCR